eukprot:Skav227637  [mRNA]  locus=scaffold58:59027:59927:+ [translate_table: standard]
MARVIAASACGAVVALGLSKLLKGKAEARQVAAPIDTKPIDGKAIAAQARSFAGTSYGKTVDGVDGLTKNCWWLDIQHLAAEAELKAAHDITPGLAVILVGSRKDSQSYAGIPGRALGGKHP